MAIRGWRQIAIAAATSALLAACGPAGVQVVPGTSPAHANTAPVIEGSPSTTAAAATAYSFVPSARDADGDNLLFSISGKPAWASFNVATGELSGTAQAGTYASIVIQVSDGAATSSLPAFTLTVPAAPASGAPSGPASDPVVSRSPTVATGTATLSWTAPSQNTDGSALAAKDLAGYRIYHGTSQQSLNEVHEVQGSGVTAFTLTQLAPGTHYFAVSAVTVSGVESLLSQVGSKTIL